MTRELTGGPRRVQEALRRAGFANDVVVLPRSARTAADAAAAIGCDVAQIVKSLVFRAMDDGRPILALTSGGNRVDEGKLAALVGGAIVRADAAFVREQTGFAIGGVPPIGHTGAVAPFLDRDLFRFVDLWAAAGHPHAVFRLTPDELRAMTGGRIADFAER